MTEKTALDLLAERVRHLETLEEIMSNIHGWDGSAWRKLPIVWGYSSALCEDLGGAQSGDGNWGKYSTAVPSGEVHVVSGFGGRNIDRAPSRIELGIIIDGISTTVARDDNPVQAIPLIYTDGIVLAEGDQVHVTIRANLDGDAIDAAVWGYKMKIAE